MKLKQFCNIFFIFCIFIVIINGIEASSVESVQTDLNGIKDVIHDLLSENPITFSLQ